VMLAGGVIATTQRLRQSFVIERAGRAG